MQSRYTHKPEALIFDLDGTLFQSETMIIPAYERALERLRAEGLFVGETPDHTIILASLGMILKEIWSRVLPNSTEQARSRMDALFLEEQLTLLQQGRGKLYPDVKQTLHTLHHSGYRLFIASNGLEVYVKKVAQQMGIASYFEAMYSAGQYQTKSKVDLVKLLVQHYSIQSGWMIGDRLSDVEAGHANQLTVIGCAYAGFGISLEELSAADERIQTFATLSEWLTTS
jgi:phosphoglycolate phosphatase